MGFADTVKEKLSVLEKKHYYMIGGGVAAIILIIVVLAILSGFPAQRFGNARHYGEISHIIFDREGARLASSEANSKAKVIVWNLSTGEKVGEVDGNARDSSMIAFGTESSVIVTAGMDEHVIFWGLDTGSKRRNFSVALSASSAISPDGNWLAYAKGQKTFVWDLSLQKQHDEFDGGATGGKAVEFSADSSMLATGDGSGVLRIYEPAKSALKVPPKKAHESAIDCLAFSRDGTLIGTGSRDNSAKLWDAGAVEKAVFKGHDSSIIAIAIGSGGKHVLTGSRDGTARLWNAETGNELFKFEGFRGTADSIVDISSDGKFAAIETKGSGIEIFETSSGSPVKKFEASATIFRFGPSGGTLYIGCANGKLYAWSPGME